MSDPATTLLVAAASGLVSAAAGAAMPRVVARLPEPEPEPEPEAGVEPTRSQQIVMAEGPKQLYADLAGSPGFSGTLTYAAGLAGALLGWAIGLDWTLLLVLPLAPIGAMLALIDLRTRLLPALVVRSTLVAAIGYGLLAWPLDDARDQLGHGLLGMVVAWLVFGAFWYLSPTGMGYGDVRLASLTGFVLGYLGGAQYAVGMYSPFLLFAVPGLILALVRMDRSLLRAAYPFGPFLVAGMVLGICFGESIVGLVSG